MVHSFLLIGQSNAAGRGFMHEAGQLDNLGGRIKTLRNGLWFNMFRPINPDRPFSGVSFAETFAKEYALANPGVQVGIIPCADGGTSIWQWQPGELLFDNALNCAKLAMRTSTLKGILWHQGETDCESDRYLGYTEKFDNVMSTLRRELGIPDLPIVIGGLGDFLANYTHSPALMQNYSKLNVTLENLGNEYKNCAFASAKGLTSNPDNLHFSAASQKELGLRYYEAFKTLKIAESDNTSATTATTERSEIEML